MLVTVFRENAVRNVENRQMMTQFTETMCIICEKKVLNIIKVQLWKMFLNASAIPT